MLVNFFLFLTAASNEFAQVKSSASIEKERDVHWTRDSFPTPRLPTTRILLRGILSEDSIVCVQAGGGERREEDGRSESEESERGAFGLQEEHTCEIKNHAAVTLMRKNLDWT